MARWCLALQRQTPPIDQLPAHSPYIDFDAMRLKMITTPTDWPRYGGYALAGVSFGFGGANTWWCARSCRVTWWKRNRNPTGTQGGRRTAEGARWRATRGSTSSATSSPARRSPKPGPNAESPRGAAAQGALGLTRPRGYGTVVPLAVSAFPDVRKRRRRVGGLDAKRKARPPRWNRSGRVVVAAQPRPARRCWPTTTTRPSRPARGRRGQAGAERVQSTVDHGLKSPVRRPSIARWAEPVPAQRVFAAWIEKVDALVQNELGLLGAGLTGRRAGLRQSGSHPGPYSRSDRWVALHCVSRRQTGRGHRPVAG